ncbi:MAG: efflux RND transporter periplasmic adaptor subunit [Anaerovoracaceae bacterium]
MKLKFNLGSKKRKVILAIVLVIAIGGGSALFYFSSKNDDSAGNLKVTPLAKTDIIKYVQTSGLIESEDSVKVSAKIDGKINGVNVKVGDKVQQGAVLGNMDTSTLSNDISAARITQRNEMAVAKSDLVLKQKEYKDGKYLASIGDLSKSDLYKLKLAYENSKTIYNQKKVSPEIQKLTKQISEGTLRAPIAGTVTAVNAVRGATSSGPLFVIERIDALKVSAKVSEYDINKIKVGQSAVVKTETTGEKKLKGIVTSVAPAAIKEDANSQNKAASVKFLVEVTIKNEDSNVKIGSNARAMIKIEEERNVTAVSFDSIIDNRDGTGTIMVLKDEKDKNPKEITVKMGIQNDVLVEISGKEVHEGMMVLNNIMEYQQSKKG